MKTSKQRIKYYITNGNGYIAKRNDQVIAYRFYCGAWIPANNSFMSFLAKEITAKKANGNAITLAQKIKRGTL